MEKLQAAIEIARRQRAAQEGRAPQAAGPGPDATDLPADATSPDHSFGDRGLDLREGELQLILGQLLRAPAELHALQLAQQVLQPLVPLRQDIALSDRIVPLRPGRQQQRAHRRGVIGQ